MNKKVNIVLSVYDPNIDFLIKQLISINEQTYPNIEVIIHDDCIYNRCDITIFDQWLTKVHYRLLPYLNENLGYTKAFERLVSQTDGDYIAFCDQDDIWHKDKIEKCVNELESSGSLLVATDRMIINEEDEITCTSVRANSNKPYDSWHSGDDICKYNMFICYAVGMSIMVNGDLARNAVPFSIYTGHDKWIIACASAEGNVSFIEEPLVKYRRHGKNISGTLKGINSKKDYIEQRVLDHIKIISDFENKYPYYKDLEVIKKFAYARKNHCIRDLVKYRYLAPDLAKFDIVLAILPNFLFRSFLYFVRLKNDRIIN